MFTARYVLHSTFCPHSVLMCFVWIWEQTAIISLYSINWLVFITETQCVYCAVRTEFLIKTTDVSSLKGESTLLFRGRVFKPQSRNQDGKGWSYIYGRKERGTRSTDMGQSAVKGLLGKCGRRRYNIVMVRNKTGYKVVRWRDLAHNRARRWKLLRAWKSVVLQTEHLDQSFSSEAKGLSAD